MLEWGRGQHDVAQHWHVREHGPMGSLPPLEPNIPIRALADVRIYLSRRAFELVRLTGGRLARVDADGFVVDMGGGNEIEVRATPCGGGTPDCPSGW